MVARNENEAAQMNQTSLELKGDREIVIERTFNGPPRIVFDAWTRPELVRRWWAPSRVACRSWGATPTSASAAATATWPAWTPEAEFAFSGVYTEVTPYSRLVYTEIVRAHCLRRDGG